MKLTMLAPVCVWLGLGAGCSPSRYFVVEDLDKVIVKVTENVMRGEHEASGLSVDIGGNDVPLGHVEIHERLVTLKFSNIFLIEGNIKAGFTLNGLGGEVGGKTSSTDSATVELAIKLPPRIPAAPSAALGPVIKLSPQYLTIDGDTVRLSQTSPITK